MSGFGMFSLKDSSLLEFDDRRSKDKNLKKLAQMVHQPQLYLKTEARAYKEYEKTMERAFWDSRIDTKTFSFYGDWL